MIEIENVKNVPLRTLSNSKTGGIARIIYYPKIESELIYLIKRFKVSNQKFYIFGSMTNVVFSEDNINNPIICMTNFNNKMIDYDLSTSTVTVGAGVLMKDLSKWGLLNSINAFQWMEGIPGTVGAGTYMNAGFLQGQDYWSFLIDCRVLLPDLSIVTLKNSDLHFSYRFTELQKNGGVVLSSRFLVRPGKKWKIRIRMRQYHNRRAKNQPLDYPSSGTVFVPPTPFHVGGMLRQLDLIGYSIGGAQISEKSPGFIINTGNMTGEDYYNLVNFIQKRIKDNFDIDLVPEVRLVGFEKNDK